MKHRPVTPLPFTASSHFIDARHANGKLRGERTSDGTFNSIATCHGERGRQHAAYLTHAANAYPKLVEALRSIEMETRKGGQWTTAEINEAASSILHELGEGA